MWKKNFSTVYCIPKTYLVITLKEKQSEQILSSFLSTCSYEFILIFNVSKQEQTRKIFEQSIA